jgi:hypothetical protein
MPVAGHAARVVAYFVVGGADASPAALAVAALALLAAAWALHLARSRQGGGRDLGAATQQSLPPQDPGSELSASVAAVAPSEPPPAAPQPTGSDPPGAADCAGVRDRSPVSFEFATLAFAASDDFRALEAPSDGFPGGGDEALPGGRLMRITSHAVPLTDTTV